MVIKDPAVWPLSAISNCKTLLLFAAQIEFMKKKCHVSDTGILDINGSVVL
jgi:hypothetical protein